MGVSVELAVVVESPGMVAAAGGRGCFASLLHDHYKGVFGGALTPSWQASSSLLVCWTSALRSSCSSVGSSPPMWSSSAAAGPMSLCCQPTWALWVVEKQLCRLVLCGVRSPIHPDAGHQCAERAVGLVLAPLKVRSTWPGAGPLLPPWRRWCCLEFVEFVYTWRGCSMSLSSRGSSPLATWHEAFGQACVIVSGLSRPGCCTCCDRRWCSMVDLELAIAC